MTDETATATDAAARDPPTTLPAVAMQPARLVARQTLTPPVATTATANVRTATPVAAVKGTGTGTANRAAAAAAAAVAADAMVVAAGRTTGLRAATAISLMSVDVVHVVAVVVAAEGEEMTTTILPSSVADEANPRRPRRESPPPT